MGILIKEMLLEKRQYIIDKVKAPLMNAIVKLAMRYPEPTKDNTVFKNTHIRIEVMEEFFKNFNNDGRKPLVKAAFRILIAECEHDGFYEFIHDWYITELLRRGWQPNRRGFPMYRYWKAPLCPDSCMESDPQWIPYKKQREKEGTLVAKEYEGGTLMAMEEIFEGNGTFFALHPELSIKKE